LVTVADEDRLRDLNLRRYEMIEENHLPGCVHLKHHLQRWRRMGVQADLAVAAEDTHPAGEGIGVFTQTVDRVEESELHFLRQLLPTGLGALGVLDRVRLFSGLLLSHA